MNDQEAKVIGRIIEGIGQGKGAPAIAADLNEARIASPNGGDWTHHQVRAAIRDTGLGWADLRESYFNVLDANACR